MSQYFKCDRCRRDIDEAHYKLTQRLEKEECFNDGAAANILDLCGYCANQLRLFMNNKELQR